jgi:hypothetical protein
MVSKKRVCLLRISIFALLLATLLFPIVAVQAAPLEDPERTIANKWAALGGEKGPLGASRSSIRLINNPDGGAYRKDFQNGTLIAVPNTGGTPQFTIAAILENFYSKWAALGGEKSFLGYPTSDLKNSSGGLGQYQSFWHGVISSRASEKPLAFSYGIYQRWENLGFEKSLLGVRLEDAKLSLDKLSYIQRFQNGIIYDYKAYRQYVPGTGAIAYGPIFNKWQSYCINTRLNVFTGTWTGGCGAASPLGYPSGNEITASDGVGKIQQFQGGIIVWSPKTGAHVLDYKFYSYWNPIGSKVISSLGYPIDDSQIELGQPRQDGRKVETALALFENASLVWDKNGGITRGPKLNISHRGSWKGSTNGMVRVTTSSNNSTPVQNQSSPQIVYSAISLYNCSTEKHSLQIWVQKAKIDSLQNAGPLQNIGSLSPQYDSWGTCPYGLPFTVNLESNYAYKIIVVDPQGMQCGSNDPDVAACQKDTIYVIGDSNGQLGWHIVA